MRNPKIYFIKIACVVIVNFYRRCTAAGRQFARSTASTLIHCTTRECGRSTAPEKETTRSLSGCKPPKVNNPLLLLHHSSTPSANFSFFFLFLSPLSGFLYFHHFSKAFLRRTRVCLSLSHCFQK